MSWVVRLQSWGYPEPEKLAPLLTKLELDPRDYPRPDLLRRELAFLVKTGTLAGEDREKAVKFLQWKPPAWLRDIGIMAAGIVVTALGGWLLPQKLKPIGVAPGLAVTGIGTYLFLKDTGVIA